MPRYEVITQARKRAPFARATAEAASLAELNSRLFQQNKPVVQVSERAGQRSGGKRPAGARLRSKVLFLQQLEACVYLGMDLRTALGLCIDSSSGKSRANRAMVEVLKTVRNAVSKGVPFSRALAACPAAFDEVSVGLIAAGEEGGTLSEAITDVRRIWARNEELRHRLAMMLIYPAVVMCAAVGVVWLLVARVVPQFVSVLSEMKVDLPWPTRLLLFVSSVVRDRPWAVLACSVLLVVGLLRLPRVVRSRPSLHRWALRVPVFGRLNTLLIQANFSRTFAQLKGAGARTTQALLLCRDLSWNFEYRAAIARALLRVQRGEPLSRALADDPEIFGEMLVNGIGFMELSGAGSEGLQRLTELLERELDGAINTLRQVLDPLLILLLGAVIGGIVFATFLPAIQILENI